MIAQSPTPHLNVSTFLKHAAALTVSLCCLASCGQSNAPSATEKDTMQAALMALPNGLGNPYTAAVTVIQNAYFWSAIFDGLTRIDKDFVVAPALAESWTQTTPTTWDFTLRKDVLFSNGEPFNAAAVAATLDWLRTQAGRASVVGDQMSQVVGAEVLSETVIRITTKTPDPAFPSKVSWLPIVAPKAWADLGPERFATAPEGTGPYRVTGWKGGDGRIELTRNAGSWRKAKIEHLTFRLIPDGVSRTQALISGLVDVGPVSEGEESFLTEKGISVESRPVLRIVSPSFVNAVPGETNSPLLDVRVRQAMNYAVNKEQIISQILNGHGKVAGQPASALSQDYNSDVQPYPYDPERAKTLLKEAGYENGFALKMLVLGEEGLPIKSAFQLMAQDLQAVGVKVELKVVTHDTWRSSFLNGEWGDARMFAMSFVSQSNDAVVPVKSFLCKRANAYFCDPALDAAVGRVEAQVTPEARTQEVHALMKAFHDSAPAVFLVDLETMFGYGPRLAVGNASVSWQPFEDLSWKK